MLVFSILIVNLANHLHRLNNSLYNFLRHNFAFIQNLSHNSHQNSHSLDEKFTIPVGSEQMIYSYNFYKDLS